MKKVWVCLTISMFLMFLAAAFLRETYPEMVLLLPNNVLASSYGDFDGDGKPEWVSLHRNYIKGDKTGGIIYVTEKRYGFIPYSVKYDLSEIMPSDIKTGDVDGDRIPEISVMVYKTAEFHKVMAKRPFFYNLKEDRLVALWLGSRLSRRFLDYTLGDLDGDGICELYAAEYLLEGGMLVQAYEWAGFGFTGTYASDAFDEILSIRAAPAGIATETKAETVYLLPDNRTKRLEVQR